ncbi:MAG: tetratricopeptide repeat protein [Ekhidna sp.]
MKYLFLTILFLFFSSSSSAQSGYAISHDSLLQIANTTQDTIRKIDALNRLAYLMRVNDPDSALVIVKESERLSRLINYAIGIGDAKMRAANAQTQLGNYHSSLVFYQQANDIYHNTNDQIRYASSLNNIGALYTTIEDFSLALPYFIEATTIYEKHNQEKEAVSSLNNIGYIFKMLEQYDTALYYLRTSWEYGKESNDESDVLYAIYNIGSVFARNGNIDSAFLYLDRAQSIAEKFNDYYVQSLIKIDLGNVYMQSGNHLKAQKHFEEAYKIADNSGMRAEVREASKYLSEVFENLGMYKESNHFHKIHKATSEDLLNRELTRRIAFQEAQYEYERAKISEDLERRKFELERERELSDAIWARNSLIAGLTAMAIIFFLLYINFSRKRTANLALTKLNEQIELQSAELIEVNKEIRVMNDNLEITVNKRTDQLKIRNEQLKEYLSSNSHIVRAPLARILGLVDLYDPKDDENLDFIIDGLNASALELDNALRDINEKLSKENF